MQNIQNLLAGLGVQVASGLVSQHDRRVVDQRPGDGHPLLLPARKLGGAVVHPVAQSHRLQGSDGALVALLIGQRLVAVVQQRQQHVLDRRQAGQQVVGLEDKADLPVADAGQLVLAQVAHVLSVQHVGAAGGPVQAAQDVHQRGLARARGAHDGQELAPFHSQVHPPQRVDGHVTHAVDFGQFFDFNQVLSHSITPSFPGSRPLPISDRRGSRR